MVPKRSGPHLDPNRVSPKPSDQYSRPVTGARGPAPNAETITLELLEAMLSGNQHGDSI